MGHKVRLAVMASGCGSNFESLYAAIQDRQLPAEIVRVIVDRPDIRAIRLAESYGIPVTRIDYKAHATRTETEQAALDVLHADGVQGILLAGYMRLLSEQFIQTFDNRIINIHPALLPSFPGRHGIEDAWDYGVKYLGATVHYVDAGIDTGRIINQAVVKREPEDTIETIEVKIHAAEHVLYPDTLEQLLNEGIFN
jgi:phosphoribosylglycinamide formyltransferase-1